jgi:hypothetical protein
MSKRGCYCGVMCNEMSIEVNISKETLNITNRRWGGPIHSGLNLMDIHANVISKDDVA